MPTEYLQIFIYCMFFFSLTAYAILDGFDIGVGVIHLFAKNDRERRLNLNAIGPVWEGNNTWIIVSTGLLFAGFPKAFANLSSSLYIPVLILLFGFMLRGAAIVFRSKEEGLKWRKLWDGCFFFSSALLAVVFSLILSTLIQGIPLTDQGEYLGSFWALLTPYSLLVAIFGLITFMMHGALYMLMKTEDPFHNKMRRLSKKLWTLFFIFWIATTFATFMLQSHIFIPFYDTPIFWVGPFLSLGCILGIAYAIKKQSDGWAFAFSCFTILLLLALVVIGFFPSLVPSTEGPSLTLYNSSASRISLIVTSIVSLLGIPLTFLYGTYVYKTFKGKVKIDSSSY